MRVRIVCVGRPRGPLADAIAEYEKRARRYFRLEVSEVKEATHHRGQTVAQVIGEEGERLLARVQDPSHLVALHRAGTSWTSEDFARQLMDATVRAVPELAFVIGGAYGLAPTVLDRANHLLSLSGMTLPHELARLVLTEQLYRAGTIMRGEPYHKGPIA